MRLSLSKVLMLAAALALVPATASAQPDLPLPLTMGPPLCSVGTVVAYPGMSASPFQDFSTCWGSYPGNNEHYRSAIEALVSVEAGAPASWAGTTNAPTSSGGSPFESVPGSPDGTLMFASPVFGPFAVALKTANFFSVYFFPGFVGGATRITFNTMGVALPSSAGSPKALSHASLYTAETVVPEPSSMILLGTGLLGLFGVEHRRRRKKA